MNKTANIATANSTKIGTTARFDGSVAPFSFALVALNLIVVVLALVGVTVVVLSFTAGDHAAADEHQDRSADAGIGRAVDTSFGSIFVEQVETIDGLTDEQLGGMSHGIADLVEQADAQVSVAVLLANRSDQSIAVDPGDYALFVDGVPDPLPPSSSTIQPLTLQPGSSVGITVTFVVPRTGADISMGYADPDGHAILIPVGRLDEAPLDQSTDNNATAPDDGHDH